MVVVYITHIFGIPPPSLPPNSNKLSSSTLFNAQLTNAQVTTPKTIWPIITTSLIYSYRNKHRKNIALH